MSRALFEFRDFLGRRFAVRRDGLVLPLVGRVSWDDCIGLSFHDKKRRLSITLRNIERPAVLSTVLSPGIRLKHEAQITTATFYLLPRKGLQRFFAQMETARSSHQKPAKDIIKDAMWNVSNPE